MIICPTANQCSTGTEGFDAERKYFGASGNLVNNAAEAFLICSTKTDCFLTPAIKSNLRSHQDTE